MSISQPVNELVSHPENLKNNGINAFIDSSWASFGIYVWVLLDDTRTRQIAHGTAATEADAITAVTNAAQTAFPDAELFR